MKAARLNWSSEMLAVLQPVMGSAAEQLQLKKQVACGMAEVWRIEQVYMIVRQEESELVICCLAGKGLLKVAPLVVEAANQAGCETIRFHSSRPGLARLLTECGFYELERVYQMKVSK